jgi:hypothetical protein
MRFRRRLCEAAGLGDLESFEGFTESGGRNWDAIGDPIVPLLDHSDAEGFLIPDWTLKDYFGKASPQPPWVGSIYIRFYGGTMAERLDGIVSKWPEDDYDREQAGHLIAALECGEAVEFR